MLSLLYLQNEGLNISWIYPDAIPFQYLKTVFALQYSTPVANRKSVYFSKVR